MVSGLFKLLYWPFEDSIAPRENIAVPGIKTARNRDVFNTLKLQGKTRQVISNEVANNCCTAAHTVMSNILCMNPRVARF